MLLTLLDLVSQMYRWETIAGLVVIATIFWHFSRSPLPLINGKPLFEVWAGPARKRFLADASSLIRAGLEQAPAFRILAESGYKTVLSPRYANELKDHKSLSAMGGTAREFHANIPGFEPFREATDDEMIINTIRTKLTHYLNWHNLTVRSSVLDIISPVSSRVFVGEPLCRNPDWLRIIVDYAGHAFEASCVLDSWPRFLRPVVAPFLSSCQAVRQDRWLAQQIISPMLQSRQAERESMEKQGKTPPEYHDAIEWAEQCSNGRKYNPADVQLLLSFAALHTTTNLLTEILYILAKDESLTSALREEATTALQTEGWNRAMLSQLQLMDSMIKETQRIRPLRIVSMIRLTTADIHLSNQTRIAKGSMVEVSGHLLSDPDIYENPETFDPYRFLKRRNTPGYGASSLLITPSPEHMGFGLGQHACPGRFFAGDEIKITLCHILLKYDLRTVDGSPTQPMKFGTYRFANPMGQIAIRRRQEDVPLCSLAIDDVVTH